MSKFRHFHLVEHRADGLFAGAVRVCASDGCGRLDRDTAEALGLSGHDRLHQCVTCGRGFIGFHARKACSDECAKQRTQWHFDREKAKNAERRRLAEEAKAAARAAYSGRAAGHSRPTCEECFQPIPARKRCSRQYCSNACRQSAYRARKSGNAGSVSARANAPGHGELA
ncbi:MAG: hypothetical protein JOZ17_27185 [Acetobacteraceae bacterium]|nr:hypothetical protein [Acetobacteraceae bacterium]MBV8614864.1 hypothetical protein [Acetobacteraceae bacterium]